MSDDAELLARHAARAEGAFAQLVQRHVDLVYSAALRVLNGDVHKAKDVTQQVFTELARQAKRLQKHPALAGWLYTTTRRMAMRSVRTEQRRQAREQEAHIMTQLIRQSAPEPDWEHLRPLLEDAMHELKEADRLAILLRYFRNQSLKEVGAALGLSDNAARMKVERALEKLRSQLTRKGVTSSAATLASALSDHAIAAAPPAFVATLASASLAGAGTSGGLLSFLKIMSTTKLKLGAGALLIAGLAVVTVTQYQSGSRLRAENESLRRQLSQVRSENDDLSHRLARTPVQPVHLPPPPARMTTAQSQPGEMSAAELLGRVALNSLPLTAEQAEKFLAENNRNAASLLAAFRTTSNTAYLDEAMRRFADDPHVAFEAAVRKDIASGEKRRWLDALKKSAPDNSLANYLSALEYFNAGQGEQAVQELLAASGKPRFDDYLADRTQANEEALRSAGYSEVETRVTTSMGSGGVQQPQVYELRDLCVRMVDLAKSYRQAGDETSARTVLQMALDLGERFDGLENPANRPPLTRAAAFAIERHALQAMDADSPFGPDGTTPKERLEQVEREVTAIRELCTQLDALYPKATPQDMINFLDRARLFGDKAAFEWLKAKYGDK